MGEQPPLLEWRKTSEVRALNKGTLITLISPSIPLSDSLHTLEKAKDGSATPFILVTREQKPPPASFQLIRRVSPSPVPSVLY